MLQSGELWLRIFSYVDPFTKSYQRIVQSPKLSLLPAGSLTYSFLRNPSARWVYKLIWHGINNMLLLL